MEFTYIGNQDKKDVRLASSFANGAFVTANSAASFANAAFDRANAAFLQANTSGGGGSSTPVTVYSDVFTANGATTTFNLSTTPTSENYIIAVVDGITQLRSTYTVTGNVIAFDTTFENGANVEITTITGGGAIDPYAANTANAAYATANAAFLQANNSSTDTWVRTQANNAYDKANSASSFANGSFVVANSASIFANASFDRANAAYAQANNSTDTWVRGQANNAYDTANSAAAFANGAFITANTAYAWGNHAAVGYATTTYVGTAVANLVNSAPSTLDTLNELAAALGSDANFSVTITNMVGTANSFANGAFVRANASYDAQNTTASFANAAFVTSNSSASFANGSFVVANSAASFANGSFVTANAAASFANGAFTQANTAVDLSTAAFIQANAAFLQANNSTDTWVRTQANSAFNTANSSGSFANGAFDRANAAYAQANTGSTDAYARSTANAAFITANLAYNVVFNSSNTASLYYITRNFTGDGNTNTFSISSNTSANSILIFDNGITQNPLTDYSVTGNTITFVESPANGSIIQVRELLSNIPIIIESPNSNSAFDRANSAYATANAAFLQANNSTDTWVRTQANSAYNTANSAESFANASFVTSNSAASFANGAFVAANSAASFANGAFDKANAAFNAANNSTDTWVRTQANAAYNAANSGASFANAAFITANAAYAWGNHASAGYATTTYVGNAIANLVNSAPTTLDTLNELATALGNDANFSTTIATSIGVTNSFANGAFLRANASYDAQNTTASLANASYTTANSGASFANAAFITANASYTAQNTTAGFANASYITANSGASFANSAFITANASYASQNTTSSFANGAFDKSNSAASFANGAFVTANAAFNAANNATDSWVRNQANNAYNTANAAFTAANTAGGADTWARAQANAAFNVANTANSAIANSGILTGYVDAFTANGVSNNYTLSTTPSNKNITFVAVQGVLQPKASYNISGTSLTFDSTPPNTAYIEVTTLVGSGGGSGGSSITWYIANANTTMVASSGYFVDTSTGPKTMTLPAAATLGDTIRFNDLAGTFSANNLTVARNSHNIQGIASDLLVDIDQSSFGLVYSNTTYGWKVLEL